MQNDVNRLRLPPLFVHVVFFGVLCAIGLAAGGMLHGGIAGPSGHSLYTIHDHAHYYLVGAADWHFFRIIERVYFTCLILGVGSIIVCGFVFQGDRGSAPRPPLGVRTKWTVYFIYGLLSLSIVVYWIAGASIDKCSVFQTDFTRIQASLEPLNIALTSDEWQAFRSHACDASRQLAFVTRVDAEYIVIGSAMALNGDMVIYIIGIDSSAQEIRWSNGQLFRIQPGQRRPLELVHASTDQPQWLNTFGATRPAIASLDDLEGVWKELMLVLVEDPQGFVRDLVPGQVKSR